MSSKGDAVAERQRSFKFLYYCSSRYIHEKYQPQFWMELFWIINLNSLHKFRPEFSVLIFHFWNGSYFYYFFVVSTAWATFVQSTKRKMLYSHKRFHFEFTVAVLSVQSNSLQFRLETEFKKRIQLQIDSGFLEQLEPTRKQIQIIQLIQNKWINVNLAVFHFE